MAARDQPNTFLQRLIGALALDATIYEEVEADRGATGQAFVVVLSSAVAAGVGSRGIGGTTWSGIVFIATVSLIAVISRNLPFVALRSVMSSTNFSLRTIS